MRSAKLVLCAVAAVLLTSCSGGGDTATNDTAAGGNAPEPTVDASPKPPVFEDFPGESVVFTEGGMRIGLKTKAIDSTWSGEVMDVPANPGYHFLAVWIAVTPELPDRGADNVSTDKRFYVRYKPAAGKCGKTESATSAGYCYAWGWPGSSLEVLEDSKWRDHSWRRLEYTRGDVKRGETRIGQVGFQIDDTVQTTAFELCAPTKEEAYNQEKFPCVPVKNPDGSR
jgi:hypothetical protein